MDMFDSAEEKVESIEKVGILDIESQRSADEVGWDNIDLMFMSIGVVYLLPENKPVVFEEKNATELIDLLFSLDKVVGYNLFHFDYKVLSYYTKKNIMTLPTVDMMLDINSALDRDKSIPLDNVATSTLGGRGKSANPLKVFEWWRLGKMKEIADYCTNDTIIEKDVYLYGLNHRQIFFTNRNGKRISIPISWSVRKKG